VVDPAHRVIISEKKETKVKKRMFVLMLILGCLIAVSVYAAKESSKTTVVPPPPPGKKASQPKIVMRKVGSLVTEMDKVSYAIGVQLATNFKRQGIDIKMDKLVQGMKDATAGKKLELTEAEIQQTMMAFGQKMREKQQEKQKADAAKNLAAGKAFLAANGKKEGVKVLPSGLQYKVIKEGTGKTPTIADKVKTHYRGTLIDGTEFDSSFKRGKPAEFGVKAVIKGWTEALQLMKEGAKWELYIPADLAYGERARPTIPANSTLIFEIELLEIVQEVVK
jgi:FKBP-type peptidyl-prolyl cis-trans isomerase FklB